MARNIYVTGGRSGIAKGTLRDVFGADLTTATIRVGLSTSRETLPTTWRTPTSVTRPELSKVVASLLITEAIAPAGTYWLWVESTLDGVSEPVLARNDVIVTI